MRVFYNEGDEGGTATAEAPKKSVKKAAVKHKTTTVQGGKGKITKKAPVKKKAAASEPVVRNGRVLPPKEERDNHGHTRTWDMPWCDKKVKLFKALKALKAFSEDTAKGSTAIAEKGDISQRDVRHYSYHAGANGWIGVADVEGIQGHAFYLTKKGAALDPVAEFKKQEAGATK